MSSPNFPCAPFVLEIANNSNTNKRILICQDVGDPVNGPEEPIQNHVYQSAFVGNDQTVTFELCADGRDYAAIVGYTMDSNTMRVQTEAWKSVVLGGSVVEITSSNDGGSASFVDETPAPPSVTAHTPDGFSISTDNSFPFPNPADIRIGWGKKDSHTDGVHPVQTWKAQPGLMTQVYPSKKYFVFFGDGKPGTVVDRSLLGKVLQVDFSDCAKPEARFILNSHACYEALPEVAENGVKWRYDKLPVQRDD